MKEISDANLLFEAFEKSKKNSYWKASIQKYEYDIWKNICTTQMALENGTYRQKDFVEFNINERGKPRHIKSIHISDRVVQRSLVDNVLTPRTAPYLIYDNGASQEGKGTDFTRKRLKVHLMRYYRKYKTNQGYVILIDFKKYFPSIDQQLLLKAYRKIIPEDDLFALVKYLVEINEGDKGLGIGAQLSQNAGVYFPSPIDNYFKTVKGIKYYGAYMDDRYMIVRTKEEAISLLEEFRILSDKYNLVVNEKKTQIMKLEKGFTFLKMRYVLTETGKVVIHQKADTFTRERRRLKKFKRKGMTPNRAADCYKAWRGTVRRYKNNYKRIRDMDKLFEDLYPQTNYLSKNEKRR